MNFGDLLKGFALASAGLPFGGQEQAANQLPTLPGPIRGYGGGSWDLNGQQVTPVQPTEMPAQAPQAPQAMAPRGIDLNALLRSIGDRIEAPGFQNPDNPAGAMQNAMVQPEGPKGMFGIKGTFRDILGTLGDAFLVNAGRDPLYRDTRTQEQLGEAFQGFQQDPMATIEKIGAINSELGNKLYNTYSLDQSRTSRIAETVRNNQFKNSERLLVSGGGMLGAANPNTYGAIRDRLVKRAAEIGDPAMFDGLPKEYDKNAIDEWVMGTMNRYQQGTEQYRNDQVNLGQGRLSETIRSNQANEGIRQQNADTGSARVNKPRKIGEYVRKEDGRKVVMYDDGSEVVGTAETRTTGRTPGRRGAAPAAAPPPDLPAPRKKGDKIVNRRTGVTYTSEDGKTWR